MRINDRQVKNIWHTFLCQDIIWDSFPGRTEQDLWLSKFYIHYENLVYGKTSFLIYHIYYIIKILRIQMWKVHALRNPDFHNHRCTVVYFIIHPFVSFHNCILYSEHWKCWSVYSCYIKVIILYPPSSHHHTTLFLLYVRLILVKGDDCW